jgi:hypothetical protein
MGEKGNLLDMGEEIFANLALSFHPGLGPGAACLT